MSFFEGLNNKNLFLIKGKQKLFDLLTMGSSKTNKFCISRQLVRMIQSLVLLEHYSILSPLLNTFLKKTTICNGLIHPYNFLSIVETKNYDSIDNETNHNFLKRKGTFIDKNRRNKVYSIQNNKWITNEELTEFSLEKLGQTLNAYHNVRNWHKHPSEILLHSNPIQDMNVSDAGSLYIMHNSVPQLAKQLFTDADLLSLGAHIDEAESFGDWVVDIANSIEKANSEQEQMETDLQDGILRHSSTLFNSEYKGVGDYSATHNDISLHHYAHYSMYTSLTTMNSSAIQWEPLPVEPERDTAELFGNDHPISFSKNIILIEKKDTEKVLTSGQSEILSTPTDITDESFSTHSEDCEDEYLN